MNRLDRGRVFWLLLCGLAIGCLAFISEDAIAVERPMGPGPYQVGYFETNMTVRTFTDWEKVDPLYSGANPPGWKYIIPVRVYFPAQGTGEGAFPDTSGAPYVTIFFEPEWESDISAYQEEIELLASHGMVVMTQGIRQGTVGNIVEGLDHFQDRVFQMENLTLNSSSVLFGMVDVSAMGVVGHRWAAVSGMHAYFITEQLKAGVMLGPFHSNPYSTFWDLLGEIFDDSKVMIQADLMGGTSTKVADKAYETFTSSREGDGVICKVDLPDSNIEGPFEWDLVVSFLFYHLRGEEGYETFLYGEEAKNKTYTGQYWLTYDRGGGDNWTFNPVFTIDVPSSVRMDENVTLEVTCDSYILLGDLTLVHEWYVGDEVVPYATSMTEQNVTVNFTDPGENIHVRYKYNIGKITIESDIGSIDVMNIAPVADAGLDRTIFQDEPYVLDGSGSYDTPSDIDTIEYNWTVEGIGSIWSTASTFEVDTSTIREFIANLTVRDRHGNWTEHSVTITIINKPPEARLGADKISDEDEVVELTGQGIDTKSHVDTLEFRWDFGDGTGSEWSSSNITNHIYMRHGTYSVSFHVKDIEGGTNSSTLLISVSNVDPLAGIDKPKDGTKADLDTKLEFNGWGRDTPSDNDSLWYFWDFDDGGTADGTEVSHTFKEAGRYTVTLTVEDNDGATAVVTHNLTIEAGPVLDGPQVFTVTVGLLAMLLVTVVAATEPGKYWFGLLGAPLFTKTRDVLDNKTRHALHGVIVENPGIHYTAIKEEFGLANGAAAHHLHVLERESFIRSVRDGKLKRFYSAHAKVPEDVGRSPEDTREAIVELVRREPEINQLGVMEELGLDRDAASYYLRELVKEDRLVDGKEGWYTVYRVK
jgi:PKD repeat protein